MPRTKDADLKEVLLREIEADMRRRERLRKQLRDIEPRLTQAIRLFRMRFGEAELPAGAGSSSSTRAARKPQVKRREGSHAHNAARALTQAQQVGKPLKIDQIRRYLIDAGLGDEQYPTRATVYSTIARSPLFRKVKRGLYALREAYKDGNKVGDAGIVLAGVSVGNEETGPGAPGKPQGSEAAPASTDDL